MYSFTSSAVIPRPLSIKVNVFASGLNIVTHMSKGWDAEQTTSTAKQMNSEWVRDEINWRYVEWTKGNLSMPSAATWVDKAVNKGMKPLCILGFGNALYQENNDEYTNLHLPTLNTKSGVAAVKEKEYWDAWMAYVSFVATTYKGKIKAYEVWNEPNHPNFNNNVNADNYAKLYIETRKVIKAIDPDATVLCGAIAGADNNFINGVLSYIKNNGGLSQIDAFSLHFYVPGSTPEEEYLLNLNRTYLVTFFLKGYKGPIWMTENGAYAGTAQNAVSESVQAAYAIRFPVMFDSFLKSVKTTGENFWYDLKNDGDEPSNSENNYGLTNSSFTAKPAYNAAKIFNKLTDGMSFVKLESNSGNYVAEYSDGKDFTYVAWTTKSGTQNVTIDLEKTNSKVYAMDGSLTDEIGTPGSKTFSVTGEPVLIYSTNTPVSLSQGTVINYNSAIKKICISGEIENFMSEQEVSFLVVPHGTAINNSLNPALIGYIKTISVNNKSFYHSFTLPEWFCGEADIYIGGLRMSNNITGTKSIPENKYMYIASIDVDKSSMVASAVFRNFTSEEKKANIIVVGYKNGRLIDFRTEVIEAPSNSYEPTEYKTTGFTLNEPVDEVKTFVWNNLSELIPLIPSATK